MENEEQERGAGEIVAERCPICDTLMTAERAGPIHFANPARRIVFPSDVTIGAGQTVTRLRCENGHTFWSIEEADDER